MASQTLCGQALAGGSSSRAMALAQGFGQAIRPHRRPPVSDVVQALRAALMAGLTPHCRACCSKAQDLRRGSRPGRVKVPMPAVRSNNSAIQARAQGLQQQGGQQLLCLGRLLTWKKSSGTESDIEGRRKRSINPGRPAMQRVRRAHQGVVGPGAGG